VAAFGTAAGRPLQGRGGATGFRFTVYAVLCLVTMYLDQRGHYLEQVRFALQAAAYPIQLAVNSPPTAWRWLKESFATREALRADNERLRQQQRDLELRTMRYEALAHENGELRGLRTALPPVAERWLPAEIINIQQSSLRQRLLLDRGASNGVFQGQAVLDERGLIGQTTHVGPWSAEVILITDPEHAVPVRVERTGLRTIAVGGGDASSLALPYLPANADVKSGDLLVTSGLGGVFPEGYPVARVSEVHRDAIQPLAQVRAAALAHINSETEVMLVWFRGGHPAVPAASAGNAAMQPLAAPPRTAASSTESTPPHPTPAPATTPASPAARPKPQAATSASTPTPAPATAPVPVPAPVSASADSNAPAGEPAAAGDAPAAAGDAPSAEPSPDVPPRSRPPP
jgi:rod shape-determining protein MreC